MNEDDYGSVCRRRIFTCWPEFNDEEHQLSTAAPVDRIFALMNASPVYLAPEDALAGR